MSIVFKSSRIWDVGDKKWMGCLRKDQGVERAWMIFFPRRGECICATSFRSSGVHGSRRLVKDVAYLIAGRALSRCQHPWLLALATKPNTGALSSLMPAMLSRRYLLFGGESQLYCTRASLLPVSLRGKEKAWLHMYTNNIATTAFGKRRIWKWEAVNIGFVRACPYERLTFAALRQTAPRSLGSLPSSKSRWSEREVWRGGWMRGKNRPGR